MFRTIRKKKNEISIDTAKALLQSSRRGVLAVNGDDGYPYAIPINYVYDDDAQKIYFHGARVGHKVDALRACDKVCFTVYGNETIKEEDWARRLGTVCAERCGIRQMPPHRIRCKSNNSVKTICNEILSQRTVS